MDLGLLIAICIVLMGICLGVALWFRPRGQRPTPTPDPYQASIRRHMPPKRLHTHESRHPRATPVVGRPQPLTSMEIEEARMPSIWPVEYPGVWPAERLEAAPPPIAPGGGHFGGGGASGGWESAPPAESPRAESPSHTDSPSVDTSSSSACDASPSAGSE